MAVTAIELDFALDGAGDAAIATGVGAPDHFLTLFCRHGLFDLRLTKGHMDGAQTASGRPSVAAPTG